jgi:hypothetical protein
MPIQNHFLISSTYDLKNFFDVCITDGENGEIRFLDKVIDTFNPKGYPKYTNIIINHVSLGHRVGIDLSEGEPSHWIFVCYKTTKQGLMKIPFAFHRNGVVYIKEKKSHIFSEAAFDFWEAQFGNTDYKDKEMICNDILINDSST